MGVPRTAPDLVRFDASDTRRALIEFDLGSLPPGSTVHTVTLTLYMSRTKAGSTPVTLHRIVSDWTEGSSDPGGQEGPGSSANLLHDEAVESHVHSPQGLPDVRIIRLIQARKDNAIKPELPVVQGLVLQHTLSGHGLAAFRRKATPRL